MRITRAITHIPIRLDAANAGKLAQLDALVEEYIRLCQQYVTAFCTSQEPDKFANAWLDSLLSERWQRAVIQHAAGIAQSWRSNRARAYTVYLNDLADFQEQARDNAADSNQKEPTWREWRIPTLKRTVIQANRNVVALEASEDSSFDYWLRVSTLDKRKTIRIPIKLAAYHRKVLAGKTINTSVTLTRKSTDWWLALSFDEQIAQVTNDDSPIVGVDVGITNFITSSTGKRYGTFNGKLAHRHKLDREKRRRKAKLRACLKKKGVKRLPSLINRRLGRHVRQEINRAVNQFYADHPGDRVAYEDLSVRTMRFKARRMNAYLYASNLGHLPKQLAWGARKRGQGARAGQAAYSSQECSHCHFVSPANRPTQQTFCCQVCGFSIHADENAAINHQARFNDRELRSCRSKDEVKALLHVRHVAFLAKTGARSASARPVVPSTGAGHHPCSGMGKHRHPTSTAL